MTGTTQTSSMGAAEGTTVIATVTCPTGTLLLGGGANVTTNSTWNGNARRFALQSSAPSATGSSAATWRAVGVVLTGGLVSGQTMSVQPWAACTH